MPIETVRIVSPVSEDNPLGYIVINAEDFREDEMELFVEGAAPIMTVAQLRAVLTEKAIAFPATAKKAELQALLDAAQA